MEKPRVWPSIVDDMGEKVTSSWKTWTAGRTYDSEVAHDNQFEDQQPKSPRYGLFVRHLQSFVVRILTNLVNCVLLVRYLLPRGGQPWRRKPIHEMHPLAYLDALRGIFSLIIVTGHTTADNNSWIPDWYMYNPWFNFTVRGGHVALDCFFWISGYVITYKMVGLMQAKRTDKMMETLVSSVFRRYVRLFLPVVVTTFVTAILVYLGIVILPKNRQKKVDVESNVFIFWVRDIMWAINPFAAITGWWVQNARCGSQMLDQFWSINTEFRSSMTMFLFIAGTCKLSTSRRKLLIWLCIPFAIAWWAQYQAMALLGMWFAECRHERNRAQAARESLATTQPQNQDKVALLATTPAIDIQQINEKRELSASPVEQRTSKLKLAYQRVQETQVYERAVGSYHRISNHEGLSSLREPLLILMFIGSFRFMQTARTATQTDVFPHNYIRMFEARAWPSALRMHLHVCVAAFFMLYPLDRVALLQRPLFSPFAQYLGELSFGIYAVQYTVRWAFWEPRWLNFLQEQFGPDFNKSFWHIFPGYVVLLILTLWAAEAFLRVDIWVMKFSRYVEVRMHQD